MRINNEQVLCRRSYRYFDTMEAMKVCLFMWTSQSPTKRLRAGTVTVMYVRHVHSRSVISIFLDFRVKHTLIFADS